MSSEVIIKPCPWCGSPGILMTVSLGYGNGRGYPGYHEYFVKCTNGECLAIAPYGKFDDIYQKQEVAVEKAIEAWNKRGEKE